MKNKAMIAAAVLAMLAVGCVIGFAVADDYDAEAPSAFTPKHPKVTSSGDGNYEVGDTNLVVTLPALDADGAKINNVVSWHVWTNDSSPKITGEAVFPMDPTNTPVDGAERIKASIKLVEPDGTDGKYTIAYQVSQYKGETVSFNLALKVVTTAPESNNSLEQTIFYKIIVESDLQVSIVEATGNQDNTAVTYGMKTDVTLKATESIVGTWYAQGLPAGLAMSSTGHIIGIPAEITKNPKAVSIFITDKNGTVHSGTFTITVEGQSKLKITDVQNAKYMGSSPTNFDNLNRYMMFTGETAKFTFSFTKDATLTAHIIDSTGESVSKPVAQTEPSSGLYTLDITPTGTGDYTISITDGTDTAMFAALVLNKIQDVKADIYFDLQPGS